MQENKVPWFTKDERKDEFDSVVFSGRLEAASQQFPVFVILDDSVFSLVRTIVTTAPVAPEHRADVALYLSELNSKFKIFKYYIGEDDGAVYLDISFPSTDDEFNPGLLLQLLGQVFTQRLELALQLGRGFVGDGADTQGFGGLNDSGTARQHEAGGKRQGAVEHGCSPVQ